MAKKKASKPKRDVLVKFFVSGPEKDLIRLAAALQGKNMADFARDIVLRAAKSIDPKDAKRLADSVELPETAD